MYSWIHLTLVASNVFLSWISLDIALLYAYLIQFPLWLTWNGKMFNFIWTYINIINIDTLFSHVIVPLIHIRIQLSELPVDLNQQSPTFTAWRPGVGERGEPAYASSGPPHMRVHAGPPLTQVKLCVRVPASLLSSPVPNRPGPGNGP